MKRIMKEVHEASALFHITAVSDYLYRVELLGPSDSLYEDVNITLYYKYKANHPFSFPVIFFRPALFHPNVDEQGVLRIPALDRSPAETMLSDLLAVVLLLHEPHICEVKDEKNERCEKEVNEKGKEEMDETENEKYDEAVNLHALDLWRHDKTEFKSLVYSSLFP